MREEMRHTQDSTLEIVLSLQTGDAIQLSNILNDLLRVKFRDDTTFDCLDFELMTKLRDELVSLVAIRDMKILAN